MYNYFGPENGLFVGISRRRSGVVSVHVLCCKTAGQHVWWGGGTGREDGGLDVLGWNGMF